jgi:putative transposase
MGENQLPKVIAGVRFQDGAEILPTPTHNVA